MALRASAVKNCDGSGNFRQTCGRNVTVLPPRFSTTPSSPGRNFPSSSSGEPNNSCSGRLRTLISISSFGISSNSTGAKRVSRNAAPRALSMTAAYNVPRGVRLPTHPRRLPAFCSVTKQLRCAWSEGVIRAASSSGSLAALVYAAMLARARSSRKVCSASVNDCALLCTHT